MREFIFQYSQKNILQENVAISYIKQVFRTINWNILFASYLQQVSGTSYGKLPVKVISCYNKLHEQRTSFLQARRKSYRRSYGTASYRKT